MRLRVFFSILRLLIVTVDVKLRKRDNVAGLSIIVSSLSSSLKLLSLSIPLSLVLLTFISPSRTRFAMRGVSARL